MKSSCTPTSGSSFPVGATAVSCTATDAQLRSASCSFTVTVTMPAPHIDATRYVAFGDSITEGKLGALRHFRSSAYYEDPRFSFPDSYAKALYDLMVERYTDQTIDMYNEGVGGEQVHGGPPPDGVTRLPAVLTGEAPQALLLLEGVNDLITGNSVASVIDGLRTMIRDARGRGVTVFLGTLLPQRPGGARTGHIELIVPANAAIRSLAAAEGAELVDVYQAFGGSPDPWIDADGLHPNATGYKKMADTFFAAIRSRLERRTTSSTVDGGQD